MRLITITALMSISFAHAFTVDMNCGVLLEAKNGKLLRRLEPSIIGLNDKYVLKTIFDSVERIKGSSNIEQPYTETVSTPADEEKVLTGFASKDRFKKIKAKLKSALGGDKLAPQYVYACVGRIVSLFRYIGAYATTSLISIEDAKDKFRKKANKRL